MSPELTSLVTAQDGVVSSSQLAAHGFTPNAVQHRISRGTWSRPAPGIVLTVSGPPTRRQRLVTAYLWAGHDAVIDADDACAWYGLAPAWFRPSTVHVAVPRTSRARTRDGIVVRRSTSPISTGDRGLLPYVDRPTAVIAAARHAPTLAASVAFLSLALQRRLVTVDDLRECRESFGNKWCRSVDVALVAVGVGVRSPAERDAAELFTRSALLPEPQWNVWLDLGDGGPPVCVDALWEDAGLVAEINGREYHAWAEQYENMHRSAARLTGAGVAAMHLTPAQIRRHGADVLHQLERSYVRLAGRGLPSAVRRVAPPSIAA